MIHKKSSHFSYKVYFTQRGEKSHIKPSACSNCTHFCFLIKGIYVSFFMRYTNKSINLITDKINCVIIDKCEGGVTQ